MIDSTNPTDDRQPIDDLVREHVEREVSAVDAQQVLARVRAARQGAPLRPRGWFMLGAGLAVGIGIGVAAALLVLVNFGKPSLLGTQSNELLAATPTDLVRGVFVAHSDTADRLYDVKVELGDLTRVAKKHPFAPPPAHHNLVRDSKLWVRGNQFWVDPGGDTKPLCWGRDRDGRVWLVLDPQLGLQYGRDEEGDPVMRLCNLMSLRVPMLAAEMLDGYELTRAEGGGPDSPYRVVGTIRSSPRDVAVSRVTLEIDPRTKVIRKAIQKRTIGNDLIGTFTYTLIETSNIPDTYYELRGHLEPGGRVMDAKDTASRNDMFNRFPGSRKGGKDKD